ncbi:hypothetical protein L2E82_36290 [Cichorium intybus]|uniref:Uncharacterized protein n=1 Tax=Cichorium intybus TaxID=13427 RepID=A0ACB9BRB3_CICIN|nr:hypothetical protein L2E82_36290 [Cichorium intybus]
MRDEFVASFRVRQNTKNKKKKENLLSTSVLDHKNARNVNAMIDLDKIQNQIDQAMIDSDKTEKKEKMILPVGEQRFEEAMQMGSETYHHLKAVIVERYEGLDLLMEAIAIDIAATDFCIGNRYNYYPPTFSNPRRRGKATSGVGGAATPLAAKPKPLRPP